MKKETKAETKKIKTQNKEDRAQDESTKKDQLSESKLVSILESLLFSTDRPLSVSQLKTFLQEASEKNELQFNFSTSHIKKALKTLKQDYESTTRGVVLEELGGGFQIRTKASNKVFLQKTMKARPFRLSGPALEVLALIAYRQPCIKAKIDEIRGIDCGHLIRALMERGLVAFDGKSELPGKPMLYKTTFQFLEIFNLKSLNDLPSLSEIEELLPEDVAGKEELSLEDVADSQTEEFLETYSAEERELEDVTETIRSIKTTTDFFETEKQEKKAQSLLKALEEGKSLSIRDLNWLENYQKKLIGETETDLEEKKKDSSQTESTQESAEEKEAP